MRRLHSQGSDVLTMLCLNSCLGEYGFNICEHLDQTEGLSSTYVVFASIMHMMREPWYLRMMWSTVPAATQTLLGIYPVIAVVNRS